MPMQISVEKPHEKRYMSIIKHIRNSKSLTVCFSTWTLEKQGGTCARFQLLKPYRLDATLKLLTRWFLQSQQKISSWKPPRAWKIYENHVTEPRHLRILLWFFPKGFIRMECSPLSQIEFRLDATLKLLIRWFLQSQQKISSWKPPCA